jgi:hypothetical protein
MKTKRTLITAAVVFGICTSSTTAGNAFIPPEYGSSDSSVVSNQDNLGQKIGNVIERVASTVSQVVSPQPADSAAAQKAYSAIPEVVCRISIAYVLSYTPVINWTYQNNKWIPIATSLVVSTPIETRICS